MMVITEEKIVIVESSKEPFDYAQFLDHTRFEQPAELSLPANAFERDEDQ